MICNPIISHGRLNLCSPADRPSPCKDHPSFDGPCPLLHKDKMNDYCANCGPRGMGAADCWDPNNYTPPVYEMPDESKQLSETMKRIFEEKKKNYVPCKWPGCTEMVRSGYCTKKGTPKHSNVVSYRRFIHKRDHGENSEPTEEWLHRPTEKTDEVPDKIAVSLGYKNVVDAAVKLYFYEWKTCAEIGEMFGMSEYSINRRIKKAGYALRNGGKNFVRKW